MVEATAGIGVRERVLEFLANYGERGLAVLKAAVEATVSGRRGPGVRLGDFSFREVSARLRAWGLSYNPSSLLRILEREYGVIETSYRSSNQHWWRFVDLDAVMQALEEYEAGVSADEVLAGEGADELDPEVELVRAQLAALGVDELAEQLRRLAAKPRLTRQDRLLFRRIAFTQLEQLVSVLRRAEELGMEEEARLLRGVLALASRVAGRLLREARASLEAAATEAAIAGRVVGAASRGQPQP